MRKVIFPLLLMASVCMIAKPTYDFRLDGIYYRIDKKQAYVAKGDELYEGDVVIPAHVEGVEGEYDVVAIDAKAFSGSKKLTSVTYPVSVTTIGESAFEGCESLKHFEI